MLPNRKKRVLNPLISLKNGGRGGIWSVVDFAYYFPAQWQTLARIVPLLCLIFPALWQTFLAKVLLGSLSRGFDSRTVRQTHGGTINGQKQGARALGILPHSDSQDLE
jgi:hypothetical protein